MNKNLGRLLLPHQPEDITAQYVTNVQDNPSLYYYVTYAYNQENGLSVELPTTTISDSNRKNTFRDILDQALRENAELWRELA